MLESFSLLLRQCCFHPHSRAVGYSTAVFHKDRIADFMEATGVSMVIGYTTNVKWTESTALDFLLLDWLQWYRDMRRMWVRFRKNYRELISITGLRAFHG